MKSEQLTSKYKNRYQNKLSKSLPDIRKFPTHDGFKIAAFLFYFLFTFCRFDADEKKTPKVSTFINVVLRAGFKVTSKLLKRFLHQFFCQLFASFGFLRW